MASAYNTPVVAIYADYKRDGPQWPMSRSQSSLGKKLKYKSGWIRKGIKKCFGENMRSTYA